MDNWIKKIFGVIKEIKPFEPVFKVRVKHSFNQWYNIEYDIGGGWERLREINDCGPSTNFKGYIPYYGSAEEAEKYAKTITNAEWIENHNAEIESYLVGYKKRRMDYLSKTQPFKVKQIK